MKETILIAEDDADIRDLLRLYLESEGFSVIEACDGEEAMRKANSAAPDLAILDVMMPRMNGLELTKALRRVSAIPILILSARSTDNDKILGRNLGADDYMTKPFAREELMARVEACLRRTGGNFSSTHYKFRNMEVNYVNKMMTVDGNYVPMNRKTYEILELLVRNKEIIMTKQQIFDRIWGYYSTTGTSVIEINIFRLRKILAEYGLDGCLKTIKATGYMWTEKI